MERRFVSLVLVFLLSFASGAQDKIGYITVSGKMLDSKTHEPVDYASVSLSGTNISNITNSEGVFTLKIPKTGEEGRTISVSHLGYAAVILHVDNLVEHSGKGPATFYMSQVALQIGAATIKALNARELIAAAYSRVKTNYPQCTIGMTAFYRELIKKGNIKYLSLNEAIIDINKAPCHIGAVDKAGIYKGRGSLNYNVTDSLLINYQGGVVASLAIDQVVNPFAGVYMSDLDMYYDFTMGESRIQDDKVYYAVNFNQKNTVDDPYFRGTIYIDSETLAIARVEMNMNVEGDPRATNIFIRRKPAGTVIDVNSARYVVNYKNVDGLWYYDYASIDIRISSHKRFSLFTTNYSIMSEMAITDRSLEEKNITSDNRVKFHDQLSKKVADFTDDDFWEDYNIIEPDQSVDIIIKKIIKQLNKRK